MKQIFLVLASLCGLVMPVSAVKFAWNAPTDASVVGYKISWGTVTGHETNSVTFGKVTSAQINNADLKPATIYFFSIKSRNASGVESVATGPILYETPPAPSPPDPATNRIETVTITITNGTFGVRTN